MAENDSGNKGKETAGFVAVCVCIASVAIVVVAGSSWPNAVAICGLSVMGGWNRVFDPEEIIARRSLTYVKFLAGLWPSAASPVPHGGALH
jgi:hypothetical protein